MESLPQLTKQTSTIVTLCRNSESTVLAQPIRKIWEVIKLLDFAKLAPNKYQKVEAEDGSVNVGSLVKVSYRDGTVWTVRILEISEVRHSIAWEVVESTPNISVTSVTNALRLHRVTDDNTTFLEWETEFSNDVDVGVIQDNKYKKLETFAELKKTFSK